MALFKKRDGAAEAEPHMNPIDLETLAKINEQSSPDTPREWLQVLYAADERAARKAADEITAADWEIRTVEEAEDGDDWLVLAARTDVILSPELVCRARAFFEKVASRTAGGQYDGWQASL
ncbi:regulator of RNase E activity RraB [Nocardioides daedukensis]|uniref:Regulator of RNase E activity RraB n=1 Tax=Nocardioides daedukensis TaxID=634462 RepID=A0A7Y9S5L2_9ACTN|nr:regulator of RNase E activity RraB [Nocardioides daedukensis]